jgi:diacylglycerol kinase family enzyme
VLGTLIVSSLASRIRDDGARHRITVAATAAMLDRGATHVEVVEAGEPEAITRLSAAAVAANAGIVVIAGGDGTVRDAAGPLANTGVLVGIVPCGTGNLYATAVGIPRDLERAIEAIRTGSAAAHDVGEVTLVPPAARPDPDVERGTAREPVAQPRTVPFVVACGTGLDARLIEATTREAKRRYGVAAYFLSASRLLDQLAPVPTIVTVDGVRRELESMVVLVANCGEAIPGRLRPRLPIEPDDGLLHVFVLPQGGVIGGIRGAIELMTADATGVSASGAGVRLAGTHVRVEVVPPGPTQVDGDVFGAAVLDARLRPGGLRIIGGDRSNRAGSASRVSQGTRR